MKRSFSLVLAIVMLLGCFVGLTAMAEGEAPVYTPTEYAPEIAYTNVAYEGGLILMFAVNAPASLQEGEKVDLLFWESRELADAFSANDVYANKLTAEETKATINGAEYLVYKYDGLSASMMTDVVYARPVFTDANGKRTYGEIVDYSVVEYVKTACGEFDGFAGLAEDVQALLKSLLGFGATAQVYLGGDEAYTPNGFLADDDLNKVWINIIRGGAIKDKVFGGFFKYEEDGYVTVKAPFLDGLASIAFKDKDGKVLEDADARADGFQLIATEGDLEISVEYDTISLGGFNGNEVEVGYYLSNEEAYSYKNILGGTSSANLSGLACAIDTAGRWNYWHSLEVVKDPTDESNQVIKVSATTAPALTAANTNAATFAGTGFGDTVEAVITLEFELGSVNGNPVNAGRFYFRNRHGSAPNKKWFDFQMFNVSNSEVKLASGTLIGTVADAGMTKFAIVIDATGTVLAYAENAEGVMVKTVEEPLSLPSGLLDVYANVTDFFVATTGTKGTLEPTWVLASGSSTNATLEAASVVIEGVETPLKDANGNLNPVAVRKYVEDNMSYYLDNFKICVGNAYK